MPQRAVKTVKKEFKQLFMSFKDKAIFELMTVLPIKERPVRAFLSALAKAAGRITFVRRRMNLVFAVGEREQAVKIVEMLKSVFPFDYEISADKESVGKNEITQSFVTAPSGVSKQILLDLKLMSADDDGFTGFNDFVPDEFASDSECAAAYLKGLFLGCGSVYVPEISAEGTKRGGYHLEFRFNDQAFAESVRSLVFKFGLATKVSERGAHVLLYMKDKNEILGLLGIMGLGDSALTLRSIIDERETANSINRAAICDAANIDKTYTAAMKQLLAIGLIEERVGLESLPALLRETAFARLDNQSASLQELADILGVTKSCLNHRFRKLNEIAYSDSKEK